MRTVSGLLAGNATLHGRAMLEVANGQAPYKRRLVSIVKIERSDEDLINDAQVTP